jgi:hypothetical protein
MPAGERRGKPRQQTLLLIGSGSGFVLLAPFRLPQQTAIKLGLLERLNGCRVAATAFMLRAAHPVSVNQKSLPLKSRTILKPSLLIGSPPVAPSQRQARETARLRP